MYVRVCMCVKSLISGLSVRPIRENTQYSITLLENDFYKDDQKTSFKTTF